MKRIVHLSDLHFTRADQRPLRQAVELIFKIRPHLIIISGDFTHRAKREEFLQAKNFLKKFTFPLVVVPGNHDIPAYNLVNRFLHPFQLYKKYISHQLYSLYWNDELFVMGLNTVSPFKFKEGVFPVESFRQLLKEYRPIWYDQKKLKILVTHHAPDEMFNFHEAEAESPFLHEHFPDLYLCGHGVVQKQHKIKEVKGRESHSFLLATCGAPPPVHYKGENNSLQMIQLEDSSIDIEVFSWEHQTGEYTSEKKHFYISS